MPGATTEKLTAAEATARREEDAALAARQREELRLAAVEAFVRLGPGLVAYAEKQWPWSPETDAPGVDPLAWKRLPRLLYLLAQVNDLVRQIDWLAIRPQTPYWCPACSGPQEDRPANYYVGECPDHTGAPAAAFNIGNTLFGGEPNA